ncbi:MAG TPA: acyltransferase domain-containing protein, partial [Acidimicrobiales bacterium]
TRFRLITEIEPWEGHGPRRAGVNAFGFGGINAHVVIEEAPGGRGGPGRRRNAGHAAGATAVVDGAATPLVDGAAPPRVAQDDVEPAEEIVLLAGADAADLLAQLDAWTASRGAGTPVPAGGPARLAIVAPDERRLQLARKVLERGTPFRGRNDVWFDPEGIVAQGGKVAFLFPGVEPVFEPHVDDVAEAFDLPWTGLTTDGPELEAQGRGIVAVGRLLAGALGRLGIEPDVIAGHSLGEWTGQIVSGMIPTSFVEEFLHGLAPGTIEVSDVVFVALGAGAAVGAELVAGLDDAYVSHDNCPHQSVICAPAASIAVAMQRAKERKVLAQELPFRSGFHSPLFEPFVRGIAEQFAAMPLHAATTPMWSATTVAPYPDDPEGIAELSRRHLVEPVHFRELAANLHADGVRAFIQVGTGSLMGFIDDTLRGHDIVGIAANTPKQTGLGQLRRVAAGLWSAGAPVDFTALGLAAPAAAGTASTSPGGSSTSQSGRSASPAGSHAQALPLGSSLVRDLTPLDLGRARFTASDPAALPDELQGSPFLAEYRASVDEASAAVLDVLDAARAGRRRVQPARRPRSATTPVAQSPAESGALSQAQSPVAVEPEGDEAIEAVRPSGVRETTWDLSITAQPYWIDHSFYEQPAGWACLEDTFPLVPMTAIIERLAEEAEALVPGTVTVAVEAVRAFKWLAVEPPTSVTVRAVIEDPRTTEIRDDRDLSVRASIDRHARAVVRLAASYPPPPEPAARPVEGEIPMPVTVERLYAERHLFHGPEYQGIRSFSAFGTDGVAGRLESQRAPGALLDNAGQLFGFWMASRVDRDRLVLPTSIDRIAFYGPHPAPGTAVDCVVNVTALEDQLVRADLELTVDGVVWCRIEGWEDRRFQSDDRLFSLLRHPQRDLLAEPQPGGWVLVREGWPDSASRDVVMRRFLGQAERADYEQRNPNVQRSWLLGRIAAKDAVRHLLWTAGTGSGAEPIFPVEVQVANADNGRPLVTGPTDDDLRISIAHVTGLGVALAAMGTHVGIDVERVEPRPVTFDASAFTGAERVHLDTLPPADRDREVTRWWAA